VQYASADYVAILRQHGMVPSMSRPANPYDNASCESFFKTLKREEIYATEYADLDDLHEHIEEFIERYYNQKRLHSALGYCSPEEFEQQSDRVEASTSATVRFFARNEEKSSTGLLGVGTQMPSLPPDPIPAGESTR
jgi:putative transposase